MTKNGIVFHLTCKKKIRLNLLLRIKFFRQLLRKICVNRAQKKLKGFKRNNKKKGKWCTKNFPKFRVVIVNALSHQFLDLKISKRSNVSFSFHN